MTRRADEPPLADPAYLRRPRDRRGHIHRMVLPGLIGASGLPGIGLSCFDTPIHVWCHRESFGDTRPYVHRGIRRGERDRDVLGGTKKTNVT